MATQMSDHTDESNLPSAARNRDCSGYEQQQLVWQQLNASTPSLTNTRHWPTYEDVLNHMTEADYTKNIKCPLDMIPTNNDSKKTLCPFGVTCCVEFNVFAGSPYSGLLQPGPSHGILRLSSAMKPPSLGVTSSWAKALLHASGRKIRTAKLFPCAALKIFRRNVASGNLLLGGSKVGQREANFFAHCVCTTMTEQMPKIVKPFVKKFWTYSNHPLSLGVSDFCRYDCHGNETNDPHFPFAIVLRPRHAHRDGTLSSGASYEDSFDGFLDQALHIPTGTVLYDVFACPTPSDVPDASKLQRIGTVTTTSEFKASNGDDGLFFRHQRKEDDYQLRPHWPRELSAQVMVGETTGTIGTLAGWKLFEQHLAEERFVDCEKVAT